MEKEQPNSKGPMNTPQEPQGADNAEKPSPLANETSGEQPSQGGTTPDERHSEASLPENDKETLGTP